MENFRDVFVEYFHETIGQDSLVDGTVNYFPEGSKALSFRAILLVRPHSGEPRTSRMLGNGETHPFRDPRASSLRFCRICEGVFRRRSFENFLSIEKPRA